MQFSARPVHNTFKISLQPWWKRRLHFVGDPVLLEQLHQFVQWRQRRRPGWSHSGRGPDPAQVQNRFETERSWPVVRDVLSSVRPQRWLSSAEVVRLKHFAVIVLLLLNFTYLYTVANGIFSQCCCQFCLYIVASTVH